MITVIIFVIVVLLFLLVCPDAPSEDSSIDTHRQYGCYRVIYPDGQISQPFMKQTAKSYAEMFGGKVVKFK